MTHNSFSGGNLFHQMGGTGAQTQQRSGRDKIIGIGLAVTLVIIVAAVVFVLGQPVSS
ncbi:hypothetical protein [Parvularcula sp. IMCC14364]|uniref:hypothetical protein n=1 Tax=Parvularcula sp. IMCC14364 TaxID=3067902 RepID=UPI0027426F19|nr:hypothetical protein [Parvularcula sp. IMCC14364]